MDCLFLPLLRPPGLVVALDRLARGQLSCLPNRPLLDRLPHPRRISGQLSLRLWHFRERGQCAGQPDFRVSFDRKPPLARLACGRKVRFKILCPSCGGHIQFAAQNLGQQIPCPHCRTTITLRKPELLKMSCAICKEHIAFPVHAIGQQIPCPHCKNEMTLKEPS